MGILEAVGVVFVSLCVVFTLGFFYQIFSAKRPPMDESNVINHIRLVWFAVTRPEKFTAVFKWLKNDEWDNMTGGE